MIFTYCPFLWHSFLLLGFLWTMYYLPGFLFWAGSSGGLGTNRAKWMGSIISMPSPSAHGLSNPSINSRGRIIRTAQTILIKDSPIFGFDCRGFKLVIRDCEVDGFSDIFTAIKTPVYDARFDDDVLARALYNTVHLYTASKQPLWGHLVLLVAEETFTEHTFTVPQTYSEHTWEHIKCIYDTYMKELL